MDVVRSSGGQAMPAKALKISREVFETSDSTSLFWLGNAGVLVLSRGTDVLLDPVLEGLESPLLFDLPITAAEIPKLDAVLITHSDGDHYSRKTCAALSGVCGRYCSNGYTAGIMRDDGLKSQAYGIGEQFCVNDIQVTLTPADHTWQSGLEAYSWREWKREDCCGFWLDTKDGCIWMPGDSRLMKEHLELKNAPDVILLDFSDDPWHISFEGAVKLANAYPHARLFCIHWGTYDAPVFLPFNADPTRLTERIVNPERIIVPVPGKAYII